MATTQYKTPGVYIQEPNSFPPSIVGVDTAVPCFIGYTFMANDSDGRDLNLTPKRVESMAEFIQFFGGGYPESYYVVPKGSDGKFTVPPADNDWGAISFDGVNIYHLAEVGKASFNLYNSMRLFYANGGGSCYVISCGVYGGLANPPSIDKAQIIAALNVGKTFIGPTMVAVPDAVLLPAADFTDVAVAMLNTSAEAGDRMALLDVQGADALGPRDDWTATVTAFRTSLKQCPPENWKFGAAYFPPLVTSVVSADEITVANFASGKINDLKNALKASLALSYAAPPPAANANANADTGTPASTPASTPGGTTVKLTDKGNLIVTSYVNAIGTTTTPDATKQLTQALIATVPGFKQLLAAVAATQGVLPPSGAIAGIWTQNDTLRGVWNAPANTGIATMIMPKLPINDLQQEDLNVPVQGMAVNAIRTFQGRGNLIWGARTLDSNSNDWRYIQVRRTMIYVEQSVKQALEAMVFKPNTAQTWVTVVSMIESFLHGLWASGGLMGASPGEAYNVQAGLGSTMTPDDVLNGLMRVQIILQMVHPAEFIELTFKQQMLGGA